MMTLKAQSITRPIYAITKEEMAIPTKLLERVAQRILDQAF